MSDDADYYKEADIEGPGEDEAFHCPDPDEEFYNPTQFWKMRDGRLIAIADMEDDHLRNALRMLWRLAFTEELNEVSLMSEMTGDMSTFAMDAVVDDVSNRTPSQSLLLTRTRRLAAGLILEWKRRGFPAFEWAKPVRTVVLDVPVTGLIPEGGP